MTLNRLFPVLLLLFCVSKMLCQDNVFLNRSYWKANPDIATIKSDIAVGNDIGAFTSAMFDPVCYALLEKTDNNTIKFLLTQGNNTVDKRTHDGRTYLFWAAYRGNLEMMRHLVDKGAKATEMDSHGYSVLNFAAVTGQTDHRLYDFLLGHGADIKNTNTDGANALLLVAPFLKNLDLVTYFSDKGLNIKARDNNGSGLFHYAAKGGDVPFLKTLIKKGIPFDYENVNGDNAMLMASKGTRNTQVTLDTFIYLERLGIKANSSNFQGQNVLHSLAYRCTDREVFEHFIQRGVDVNKSDADGHTPFMNAASQNALPIVTYLLEQQGNHNALDNAGRSSLTKAVEHNSADVVDLLLKKGAKSNILDDKGNSIAYYLLKAYEPKKTGPFDAKLRLLLEKGVTMTAIQENGNTLLHIAARENNLGLLERLEEFKIPIDHLNNEGYTALHLAAMSGTDAAILKYLITLGANKELKTAFDETTYQLISENELLQDQLTQLDFLK